MKKAEMITGVFLLLLAIAVIWEAANMPPSASFGPGAGFLPFWLGLLLAVLAIMLCVSAWRSLAKRKESGSIFPRKQALLAVTLTMAGLAGYILLIEILGYLVDTFLFVVFLVKVVERETWRLSLPVAAGTVVGLYTIFHILLRITLPVGMFGF